MNTAIIYWIDYTITTNLNYNMQIEDIIFHLSPPGEDRNETIKVKTAHKISYRGQQINSILDFHNLMRPYMQLKEQLIIKTTRSTNGWKINISPLSSPFDKLEINCLKYLWY